MQLRGEPSIGIGDVTVDERDVEALRGIEEYGSMHRAAAELGRSYSRIQQRITELEEALGSLVARERGGEGGGGSTLTANAYDLLAQFDRLRAEFTGLARAEESVFPGAVVDRDGLLGTIETPAGIVRGITPTDADRVQVSIRSDVIALTAPDETPQPAGTSVRNQFRGTVARVESERGLVRITVDIDADTPLRVLVTQASLDALDLTPGDDVVASFKATATRAVPAPDAE
ncbi:TOBE domain-containing protein [Haloplanus sp. GCM10025708]|uniref:TOBE domain-containing protein n=1 Tax=Haloferacaceae TaxID=1644056 RepID=UPI0036151635